jgi:hypothetical protein
MRRNPKKKEKDLQADEKTRNGTGIYVKSHFYI